MYLPYVYKLTHIDTNQFYIGMRSSNRVVAELDLGKYYFSSNKFVKQNFNMFKIEILAYFKDQESAFEFENKLIEENFQNNLILNKHYQKHFSTFSMSGMKRPDLSEYNKIHKKGNIKPREDRIYYCINCGGDFIKNEPCHHKMKLNFLCSRKCSAQFRYKDKPIKISNKRYIRSTNFKHNNPMKNPNSIKKMIETRKRNKASRLGDKAD